MYAELGCTLTVCMHWASSPPLAAPASAPEPECTGLAVTWSVAAHVQPASVPVSKPGLANRFAAAAAGPAAAAAARNVASSRAAGAAIRARRRVRFMRPPAGGSRRPGAGRVWAEERADLTNKKLYY